MRGERILARGRRMARERMSETVRIGQVGEGFDPETGAPTQEIVVERYAGPARVSYPGTTISTGDRLQIVASQDITVSIPHGSPVCFEGDQVVVSASTADGALVGKTYTVQGAAEVGQTSAHRYRVSELS